MQKKALYTSLYFAILHFLRQSGSQNFSGFLIWPVVLFCSVCGVYSVLFYATVCWGGSVKHKDARCLDKLVKKAGSGVGIKLDSMEDVLERCSLAGPSCCVSHLTFLPTTVWTSAHRERVFPIRK